MALLTIGYAHLRKWNERKQELTSVGLTHIHTCRSYVHATRFHERRISSVTFASAHLYDNCYIQVCVALALADSSDLGLLGEQSSQKWERPCPGRRWTAVQNLTPLALSSAEKSVIVQTTNTQKTNTQTNSNRYIHTLHVWIIKDMQH